MHILVTDHGHIKNTSTLFRDVLGKISFTRWISYDMHFIGSQMRFKYFDTCQVLLPHLGHVLVKITILIVIQKYQ